MSKWPKDNPTALKKFYGDPARGEVAKQLVRVEPPFRLYYEGKLVKSLSFHKKAADALLRALNKIWDYYDHNQAKIDALEISKYSGAYNHRKIRGSATKWSNHAYAAAIDLDAEDNGFGTGRGDLPWPVIAAFKSEGAAWGGDYRGRTDPMHFEFCDRGEPTRTFEEWLAHYNVKVKGPIRPPEDVDEGDASSADVLVAVTKPKPPHGEQSLAIEAVQRRLRDLGYSEVGEIDGKWGSMTAAGIAAFKNDRHCDGPPLIDEGLVKELDEAEKEEWKRPIAPARAFASTEEVGAKFESAAAAGKAVEASRASKVWAWVIGIPGTIVAFVKGIVDNFEGALESPLLGTIKEFFADNIALLALGVVGIAAMIWWKSGQAEKAAERAEDSTVLAFQEGRLKS